MMKAGDPHRHRAVLGLMALLSACAGSAASSRRALAPPTAAGVAPIAPSSQPAAQPGASGGENAGAPASAPAAPVVKTYVSLEVPMFSDLFADTPVASVGDEAITIDELASGMVMGGQRHAPGGADPATRYLEVLGRLTDTRLMLLEARSMGIDAEPEMKAALADKADAILIEMVKAKAIEGVQLDAEEAEKVYREMVKEWKVKSLLFAKEEDARNMVDALAAGQGFDALAEQAVKDGKAKTADDTQWLSVKQLLPQVHQSLRALAPGGVSPPVKVADGFVVMRLDEVRHRDDPEVRVAADEMVLEVQRRKAVDTFYDKLLAKLVKTDEALIRRIDFASPKKSFSAFMQDKRVLARIEGAEAVTVGDLAQAIAKKYFHGVEPAIREKKINNQKEPVLRLLLVKRVAKQHAVQEGLAASAEYRRRLKEESIALLVGAFIDRIVVPEIDVKEGESQSYYEQHVADYSYPEFFRLRSLGFESQPAAETALKSLAAGTDLKWLEAHAEKLAPPDKRTLVAENMTLSVTGMEPALAKALAGAQAGDLRLYASPDGVYYLVQVTEHVLPQPQPYAEAREKIVKKLFDDKLNAGIKEWLKKLRAAYEVRIYIQRLGPKTGS